MNLNEYNNDILKSGDLLTKLKQRVFLKTQLDVVYNDFTNWEKGGLISIGEKIEKGKWKHLSYTEYTWVRIIEVLRKYGFTYEEVKALKKTLLGYIPGIDLYNGIIKSQKGLDEIDSKRYKLLSDPVHKNLIINMLENTQTYLDGILVEAISKNQHTSILFYKNSLGDYAVFSKSMLEISEDNNTLHEFVKYSSVNHMNVSINQIISKFINIKEDGFPVNKPSLLNEDEYKLLKIIRNKPENLRQIKIRFKNDQIDVIEVESIQKKVALESRLMDHIQKGDYSTMEITSQDGMISFVKNTTRIKI